MMNAPVKLMEQRCPSCNAPLTVSAADNVVTCRYCNNSITINRQKPPANVPRVTTFGTPGHVPSTVLYMPAATIGASILPALIPVVVVLVVAIGGAITALGRRFVSLPATCHPNETMTISGKKFDGTQPAIVAGVNCKITIKDSTITSTEPIVKGGINLELRIENSKLKSKTRAIDLASTNAKIWISGKSEISGDEAGIFGENNVEVEVKDSTVTGGQDGIHLGTNGKLNSKGSSITGEEAGLHFEGNGVLEMRSTTITSSDVALFFQSNGDAKITDKSSIKSSKSDGIGTTSSSTKMQIEDSKIDGADVGIRASSNSEIRLRKGASVHGTAAGIKAENSFKLSVEGASIDSAGPGVQGSSNAEIRVTVGSMVKGTPAFQFPSQPSRFDVPDGTFTGEKQLDSKSSGGGSGSSAADNMAMRMVLQSTNSLVAGCKDGKSGVLTVKILVAPSGKVTDVVKGASTVSKTVETCAISRLPGRDARARRPSTRATRSERGATPCAAPTKDLGDAISEVFSFQTSASSFGVATAQPFARSSRTGTTIIGIPRRCRFC